MTLNMLFLMKRKYKIIDNEDWYKEIKNIVPISAEAKNKYTNLYLDNNITHGNKIKKHCNTINNSNLNLLNNDIEYRNNPYDLYYSNNDNSNEYAEFKIEQTYIKNGINKKALKKLRRVQECPILDLHGHTIASAYGVLLKFIHTSYINNEKYVLIVHGKGLSSPNQQPVLKPKIHNWLTQHELVMGFMEGSPQQGGGGSTIVLLKSNYSYNYE